MSKFLRLAVVAATVGVGLTAIGGAAVPTGRSGAATPVRSRPTVIDTDRVIGPARGSTGTTVRSAAKTAPPVVTVNPVSVAVASAKKVTFTAAATGKPKPTVQWEVSTDAGVSFSPIAGAVKKKYSLKTTIADNGDEYEAVFTNSVGAAITTAATLTVTTPSLAPQITTDPTSATVVPGGTATFTAAASGTPVPTVQWEVSTDGGDTFDSIAGATATTYSFTVSIGQSGDEYEAVFTNSVGTATTTAATVTVETAPATGTSTNWSGYADTGDTFSAVTGSWTIPTVTCTGTQSAYSSDWVGIDGDVSSTVEQDGTEGDCISGSPSYDAWYELYGDASVDGGNEVELSPSTYPVSPGDQATAAVSETDSVWTFDLTDTSTAHPDWSFTTTDITFTAALSSAEWIVERPELCSRTCSLTSLADFETTSISAGSATTTGASSGAIGTFPSMEIAMVSSHNGSKILAQPSTLTAGGTGFADVWEAAS